MTNSPNINDLIEGKLLALQNAGRTYFTKNHDWENILCVLTALLLPKQNLSILTEALPSHNYPLTELDVRNILAHMGFITHITSTKTTSLDPRLLPCLCFDDNNTPYIIISIQDDEYTLWYKGERTTRKENKLPLSSTALWLFRRVDENVEFTSKFIREGTGFGWFRALFQRFKTTLSVILGTGFVLNLLALATPLFIMIVYDRVIGAGSVSSLPMLALGVMGAILLEWLFRSIRSGALSWLSSRLDNIVGNAVFSRMLGLSPDMIERASVAAQIARIKTFESVRDFFSGPVFLSVIEIPFVLISVLAMYLIAGPLVLVPLIMSVGFFMLFWYMMQRVRISIRLAAKASSASQQFSIQTFEKIRAIKCNGLSQLWYEKYRDLTGREMMAQMHLNWQGIIAETVSNALIVLSVVLTAVVGAHLIWTGTLSTGALVASMILVWRILTPFHSLASMVPRFEQLRNSILQIDNLMDMPPEQEANAHAASLSNIEGQVIFQNASCSYEAENPVFTNLNLMAQAGDFITITGDNGAGKSSLLKIIKRMHDLSGGTLSIDGFDIRQLRPDFLRRQIAYIPQQPAIFEDSILENLRLASPLSTIDNIETALRMADAWDDVRHLPLGLESPVPNVHDHNTAARLALARAYLKDTSILLIDEIPNTILCGEAGKHLRDFIIRNKGKRTIFMVTYRDDFIRMSDTTILLKIGKPAIVGTPNEIIHTMHLSQAA